MTADTPDWDTAAEMEAESVRDAMTAALEGSARLLAWWEPRPLCIDGREYARRLANRRKRGR